MFHKTHGALSVAVLGFAASYANGQTINIDYGQSMSPPSSEYAGAGSPGFWNTLDGEHGVPESLYRVDLTPLPATVTLLDGAGGPIRHIDDPSTTGGDQRLLDDYAHGGTDVVGRIRFDDLENDTYEVIVYAWTPGSPDVFTAVWPDCDMQSESYLVGGPWPGQLEEGVTHARFITTVSDGTLQICTAGGIAWEGAINGIQLIGTDCDHDGPSLCSLPPNAGPCDGICPMFYYNPCRGGCELFDWGCCEGNDNKFETWQECEATCPPDPNACHPSSMPQEDPTTPNLGFGTKNRYLSFSAGHPGRQQAIQVVFLALPSEYDYAKGRTMWLGEPWNSLEPGCTDSPCPNDFWAARLECEPFYMDWTTLSSFQPGVHVYDAGIISGGVYEIRVIDETCSTLDPWGYSTPLWVRTSGAGDVVGDSFGSVVAGQWDPPQGLVDFNDIYAIVEKFKNLPGSTSRTRADIINSDISNPIPDQQVDFVDISACMEAFRGAPLPPPGPPMTDPCAGL